MQRRQHSMTVIISRIFVSSKRVYAGRKIFFLPVRSKQYEARIECYRRHDGVLFNFVAYGSMATTADGFLQEGGEYTLEYLPFSAEDRDYDDESVDGQIVGMNLAENEN